MTLSRLPDSEQVTHPELPCRHAEHDPPKRADVPPGSYLHTCPACGNKVRIEVYSEAWPRAAAAPLSRPRPPKSFASRFWGALRAASGALGRRPRWFWRWAWNREFDALCVDHDRSRAASNSDHSRVCFRTAGSFHRADNAACDCLRRGERTRALAGGGS